MNHRFILPVALALIASFVAGGCAPDLKEVNFWASSGANFRALQLGELFLFKLHAPRNVIVGGGVFAYANSLPCSLAW